MEVPALYRYLKKSKDWYGALTYTLLKPVNYLLPILGPAMEAGSFERMVLSNVLKEAKYDFIKENGNLNSTAAEVKKKLKTSLMDLSEAPEELPLAA